MERYTISGEFNALKRLVEITNISPHSESERVVHTVDVKGSWIVNCYAIRRELASTGPITYRVYVNAYLSRETSGTASALHHSYLILSHSLYLNEGDTIRVTTSDASTGGRVDYIISILYRMTYP
jgi:hypothetical protein